MNYRVLFSLEAEEQLVALYHYIADAASHEIAEQYTEGIVNYCNLIPLIICNDKNKMQYKLLEKQRIICF